MTRQHLSRVVRSIVGPPRSVEWLLVLLCLLAACETRHVTPSRPTRSRPTATQAPISERVPTPLVPSRSREFTNASEAQPVVRFTILAPMFVPADLRVYRAWVHDYANGRQKVRILYLAGGEELDPTRKAIDLQLDQTNAPITLDSVLHQFRTMALDPRAVQVRHQTGYAYWERSGAMGNIANLVWREAGLNIQLSMYGDWHQPGQASPHDLDPLLLQIAESLRPVRW